MTGLANRFDNSCCGSPSERGATNLGRLRETRPSTCVGVQVGLGSGWQVREDVRVVAVESDQRLTVLKVVMVCESHWDAPRLVTRSTMGYFSTIIVADF